MNKIKYGCHADLEEGQEPDGCVIDTNDHLLCIYAREGMCKEECEYWKPYTPKSKPPKRITREEYQKALLDNAMVKQPDFTRMLNESVIKDAYIASLEANQKD